MTRRVEHRLWALAFVLAIATPAWAHPPHIDGWKPVVSVAIAALVAAFVAYSLRKNIKSLPGLIGAGLGMFILFLLGGLFVSFVTSL
jgi:hypothetical protein